MKQVTVRVVVAVFLLFAMSGCFLLEPHEITAGSGDKLALLNKRIGKFHRALYWGSMSEASGYISPQERARLQRLYSKRKRKETLVDLEVQSVDMKDEQAEVTVRVRYYEKPVYTVNTRFERETWAFNRFGGGWLMAELRGLEPEEYADYVE